MVDLIKELQNKDDKAAYKIFQEMSERSAASDLYYEYFEDFVGLLTSKSSYVRTLDFVWPVRRSDGIQRRNLFTVRVYYWNCCMMTRQ